MEKTILVIEIDKLLQTNISYEDKANLWIAVLWSLELAKGLVIDKMEITRTWIQKKNNWERKVNKNEALALYLKTRRKIEKRINAINQASEWSTFVINKDLFDEL